jgi:hypothetical protein
MKNKSIALINYGNKIKRIWKDYSWFRKENKSVVRGWELRHEFREVEGLEVFSEYFGKNWIGEI